MYNRRQPVVVALGSSYIFWKSVNHATLQAGSLQYSILSQEPFQTISQNFG